MKKRMFIPLVALALVLPLTSCGGSKTSENPSSENNSEEKSKVYFGLGSDASFDAKAQTDVDLVAALFDEAGKILDIKIDSLQVKVTSTEADVVTLAADGYNDEAKTDIKSKHELKEDYGMKFVSGLQGNIEGGAEWYEQAISFENWAVGKTLSEIKGSTKLNEKETGDVLVDGATIGTTINVDMYVGALDKAFANKFEVEASVDAKVGVGMFTTHASVANEHSGVQTDVTVSGLVLENGKVAGSKFDVYQIPYVVTAEEEKFVVSVDTAESKVQVNAENSTIISKETLKYDYNMKFVSGLQGNIEGGAEWFEQAASFQAWAVGKTPAEIAGLELTDGAPTNGGAIGTTMIVTDFLNVYAEAAALAKAGR